MPFFFKRRLIPVESIIKNLRHSVTMETSQHNYLEDMKRRVNDGNTYTPYSTQFQYVLHH